MCLHLYIYDPIVIRKNMECTGFTETNARWEQCVMFVFLVQSLFGGPGIAINLISRKKVSRSRSRLSVYTVRFLDPVYGTGYFYEIRRVPQLFRGHVHLL